MALARQTKGGNGQNCEFNVMKRRRHCAWQTLFDAQKQIVRNAKQYFQANKTYSIIFCGFQKLIAPLSRPPATMPSGNCSLVEPVKPQASDVNRCGADALPTAFARSSCSPLRASKRNNSSVAEVSKSADSVPDAVPHAKYCDCDASGDHAM